MTVESARTFPVVNPFTNRRVGEAPEMSPEQVRALLHESRDASPRLPAARRAEILDAAADHYEAHLEEAARLITDEAGICLKTSRHEVRRSINCLRAAALLVRRFQERDLAAPYHLAESGPNSGPVLEVVAEPLDLAVAITPFNHPLNQVVHKAAPAIAAGTPLVLKPSEKTPLSAIRLEKVFQQCGLPRELFRVVTGDPSELVREMISCPGIELVSFTGSVAIGKSIARSLSATPNPLVRVVAELGGNAALVVAEDADLDRAAQIATGAFDNAGQRCTAIKRIIVDDRIADAFLEAFLGVARRLHHGDPYEEKTEVGPVIDESAAKEVERRVDSAIENGARLLLGHSRDGALLAPTVLDRVTPEMELVTRETFGPVAPILRVQSLEACVEIVRGGPFRLAGAIVTRSEATARRYADAIGVGQFSWNGPPGYRTEHAPFGGFGDSGNGTKEGIVCAMEGLMKTRTFYSHS